MDYSSARSTLLLLPLSTTLVFLLATTLYYLRFSSTSTKRRWTPTTPDAPPLQVDAAWLQKSPTKLVVRLRRLREELGVRVVTFKFGASPTVFVADRALIHEAMVQKGAAFAERPPNRGTAEVLTCNGCSVSNGSGAVWRALRRNIISEMLHPTRVRGFASERQAVVGRVLKGLKEEVAANGEGVVVVPAERFRRGMFEILLFMCFGERVDDRIVDECSRVEGDLVAIADELKVFDVLPRVGKLLFWKRWRKAMEIWNRQRALMIPLITAARDSRRHRNSNGPQQQKQQGIVSYVDSLLDLDIQGEGSSSGSGRPRKLTEDELVSLCFEFFEAGIDTMETTTEWVMANLVKYPQFQSRLAEELLQVASQHPNAVKETQTVVDNGAAYDADRPKMPYLQAVIYETLRRHPPGPFLLPHRAAQETTLGGGKWTVSKDATVFFAAAEMGWDSAVWEDPMEFRPERFLEGLEAAGVDLTGSRGIKMIPFGAGRRICPGIGVAMLHLEDFIAGFIREFDWRPEVEGGDVDLSEKHEFTLKIKNSLRARIYTRSPVVPAKAGM